MRKSEFFKRHTYTPNSFYDYMARIEDAMSGDIETANIIPAEADKFEPTAAEATAGVTYDIVAQCVNSDGDPHTWFNGTYEIEVVVDASDGNVSVNGGDFGGDDTNVDADVEFVAGEAKFTVTLGGTWVVGDDVKVNVPKGATDILGVAFRVQNHDIVEVQA